jgi:predicted RNase H-like HicB family nuclease
MRFAVVIEIGKCEEGYSAYVPDLLGCVARGRTMEELRQQLDKAVEHNARVHRELNIPLESTTIVEYIEVD